MTIIREYRLTCDLCHRQYPKRTTDEVHLGELARDDGWVHAGKRDVCAGCLDRSSGRALRELADSQARRRAGRR